MKATGSVFRLFFFKKWGSELPRHVNGHPTDFSCKNCSWSRNWQKWQDCKWSLNWVRCQETYMVTLLSSVPHTVHVNQTDWGTKKDKWSANSVWSWALYMVTKQSWVAIMFLYNKLDHITNLHHSYVWTIAVQNSQNK